jgi:cyclase
MLKKRLIGVVTVKNGWAVQSFGYRRYLPLGTPEVIVENLDRWGVDEILVQCIDRSKLGVGPDFPLLRRIATIGLSTPVIYSGGIRSAADGVEAVRLGADRVAIDSMIHSAPREVEALARELGVQAVIGHLPVSIRGEVLYWRNYLCVEDKLLNLSSLAHEWFPWISEMILTDWMHEGIRNSFDELILKRFPDRKIPLILFGGLSESDQIKSVLKYKNVVAAAIGNSLNYREHSVQRLKKELMGLPLRSPEFDTLETIS